MKNEKVKNFIMKNSYAFWESLGYWELYENAGKPWEFIEKNYYASALNFYKNHNKKEG